MKKITRITAVAMIATLMTFNGLMVSANPLVAHQPIGGIPVMPPNIDVTPMTLSEITKLTPIEVGEHFLNGDYTIIRFSPQEIFAYQQMMHSLGLDRDVGLVVAVTLVIPGNLSNAEIEAETFHHLARIGDLATIETYFGNIIDLDSFTSHPFTTTNRLEISNPQRQPGLFHLHPRIGIAATGSPNVTMYISQTSSLSNSFTTTAGVTAAAVSAAVGFSVTQSRSMTVQGSWTSPAGSRGGMFEAFGLFNRYTFDVWSITRNSAGAIVGNDWVDRGNAHRSTGGVYFVGTAWW